MKFTVLVACIVACGACSHAERVSVASLTNEVFAPSATIIAVYDEFPASPHVQLARLSTYKGPDALYDLREKARSLGADAIVLEPSSDQTERVAAAVVGGPARRPVIRAVAIRFKRP